MRLYEHRKIKTIALNMNTNIRQMLTIALDKRVPMAQSSPVNPSGQSIHISELSQLTTHLAPL